MSESEISLSQEKVADLKEKHDLSEQDLEEIIESVEVQSKPVSVTKEAKSVDEESGFLRAMNKGDLGTGEALVIMDFLDRKERQRIRDEKKENESKKPPRAEGIPEWAKPMMAENKEILARMKSAEEEKKIAAAVKDATDPLKTELEKKDDRTTRLEETVAKLSEPPKEKEDLAASVATGVAEGLKTAGVGTTPPPPPKNYVDDYIESRDKLKKVGLLQEQKSNIMRGPGGSDIPISGEIPAVVAYLPTIFKELATTAEDTIDRVAKKYGLFEGEKPGKPGEPLIKMPEKPRAMPPKPEPAAKPVEPIVEAPAEVTIIELETEPESLIVMPKKPIKETAVKPVTIKKPERAVTPKPKGYSCKYCNAGPFDRPWKIAGHVKKCAKAIEAKKKEKKPDE